MTIREETKAWLEKRTDHARWAGNKPLLPILRHLKESLEGDESYQEGFEAGKRLILESLKQWANKLMEGQDVDSKS